MTGGTPLHPDLDALDLHILVERRPEIIVLVLVLVRCRGDTQKDSVVVWTLTDRLDQNMSKQCDNPNVITPMCAQRDVHTYT